MINAPWSSATDALSLREAVNRLLEQAVVRPSLPPPRLIADVYETPDGTAFVIEMPVPGLSRDEIKITATSDSLTVEVTPQAPAEEAGRTYMVRELQRVPMARVFTFTTDIDLDKIEAKVERGMLVVRVPKAVAARSRVIPIQSGD